jgi:hypothetical protein
MQWVLFRQTPVCCRCEERLNWTEQRDGDEDLFSSFDGQFCNFDSSSRGPDAVAQPGWTSWRSPCAARSASAPRGKTCRARVGPSGAGLVDSWRLPNGVPPTDTFAGVFQRLKSDEFLRCLSSVVAVLRQKVDQSSWRLTARRCVARMTAGRGGNSKAFVRVTQYIPKTSSEGAAIATGTRFNEKGHSTSFQFAKPAVVDCLSMLLAA